MKTKALFLIPAALCFAAAAFFRFALIGYGYMALLCAGVGVCVLLYAFLPKRFRIMLTILLALGLVLFIVGEVPLALAAGGTPEYDAEYLIVLGAGVNGTAEGSGETRDQSGAKYLIRGLSDYNMKNLGNTGKTVEEVARPGNRGVLEYGEDSYAA